MNTLRLSIALLLFVLFSTAWANNAPAGVAYKKATEFRERSTQLLALGSKSPLKNLLLSRDTLLEGISYLNKDDIKALAEGYMPLRFRRFNLLSDLVRVQVWLGDRSAALAALKEIDHMVWQDGLVNFISDGDAATDEFLKNPENNFINIHELLAKRDSSSSSIDVPYTDTLSEAVRIAGLSKLWMAARDQFVWFDHVPDLDWDRLYLDTIPEVQAAPGTEAYYRVLTKFMAKLRDGHTGVYPPRELKSRWYSRPGLRTALIEGKIVVTSISDQDLVRQGLNIGDEVTAINGEPVKRYADKFVRPYLSSSTPQDLEVREYTYALLSGDASAPVTLSVSHSDGSISNISAVRNGYVPDKPPTKPLLTFRDDGVAVLRIPQLLDDASLKALQAGFHRVKKASGLILDLRGNGGGTTSYGLSVLSYIASTDLPNLRSQIRDNGSPLQQARQGRLIEWRSLNSEPISPVADPYSGPVVMLVDAATFSAGEDVAAVFRLMRRGPIIGQRTGGSTGQPLMLDLPGGGSARICIKRDSFPNGSNFVGVGITPDETIERRIEDVRSGRDSVLERALKLLSESKYQVR